MIPSERLARRPVIPVIVIDDENDAEPLAEALLAGGLDLIEVTLRTAAAFTQGSPTMRSRAASASKPTSEVQPSRSRRSRMSISDVSLLPETRT